MVQNYASYSEIEYRIDSMMNTPGLYDFERLKSIKNCFYDLFKALRDCIPGDITELKLKQELSKCLAELSNLENPILALSKQIFTDVNSLAECEQLLKQMDFPPVDLNIPTNLKVTFVISQVKQVSQLLSDYLHTANQSIKNEKLLMLLVALRKLKDSPLIQGDSYIENIQKAAEQWLILAEKEFSEKKKAGIYYEIPNQFIYGKPIALINTEIFMGRKDVIEMIREMLMKFQKPTLFLYGRRRTGKTSAVLNLNRFLEPLAVTVPVDLQNLRFRESSSAFCQNISKEISQYLPALRDAYDHSNFQQNPFTALDEFLDAAEQCVSETKRVILLAFDEYERLDASHKNILDTIRVIIQHRHNIVVLVAGSRRFSEIKGVNWADYLINTQTVEISYLDRESAYKLITNPIEGFDLVYAEGMPEAILESTHCQPYLLQAVGSELVNYLNLQQRKAATLADLEIVKRNVLTAAEAYFTNVWFDECNDSERAFLEQLIFDEQDAVPFEPRHEPMRSLLRKETLERRNEQVSIAVPLFRQWIREKHLMMTS